MMKKCLCCLLAALFLLISSALAAEPRYPAENSVATDAASVFTSRMLDDLRTLDKRLGKADAPRLRIVTVDFLDGMAAQAYADALFDRWKLNDDELLLLLAVGEDTYAIAPGRDVLKLVPSEALNALLTSEFREPFLAQQYEQAAVAYVRAVVQAFSRACGETIRTDDLFAASSGSLLGGLADSITGNSTAAASFVREESILVPIGKALIIVALMFLVVSLFRRMRGGKGQGAEKATKTAATPQYFRKREKQRPTTQYFRPRKPRQ